MKYKENRNIYIHYCWYKVSGSLSELLSIMCFQNILQAVKCGSYMWNVVKQFLLNAIVHPGQNHGASTHAAHYQLYNKFFKSNTSQDSRDANRHGLPTLFPKLKFYVYKAWLLFYKRSVYTQYSIALYINNHVYLPESTNIKPLNICQLP